MNVALWVVQGILCVVFVLSGGIKLVAYETYTRLTTKNAAVSEGVIPRGLAAFIGVCEVAGGLGLVLPSLTGIAPILTRLAAAGLAIIMLLAGIFHWRRKESLVTVSVLFVLSVFVVIFSPGR
jgi:uncharacterized membrane protein YphA (DoxX/SURF4 family)